MNMKIIFIKSISMTQNQLSLIKQKILASKSSLLNWMNALLLCFIIFLPYSPGIAQKKAQNNSKSDNQKLNPQNWIIILQKHKTNSQRVQAAIELGNYKGEKVVTALLQTMQEESNKQGHLNQVLLQYIVRSLGQIGNKRAFLPLIRLSQKDVSVEVQEAIEHALTRIQHN